MQVLIGKIFGACVNRKIFKNVSLVKGCVTVVVPKE